MKFRFIATEKAHHSLGLLCRCLRVTHSGFYAWQQRPDSARTTILDLFSRFLVGRAVSAINDGHLTLNEGAAATVALYPASADIVESAPEHQDDEKHDEERVCIHCQLIMSGHCVF